MDSYLVFMNFPPSNRNIQNVIAKMESGQGSSKKDALLVNCHFDSVPQSPGASDDAVRDHSHTTSSHTFIKHPKGAIHKLFQHSGRRDF